MKAEILAKLLLVLSSTTDNVGKELLMLAKVISKQNVQSVNWFLL